MNESRKKHTDFPFQLYLKNLYDTYQSLHEGEVGSYIPELAKANPMHFGITVVTTDGTIQEVGDSRVPFTIQSLSKPFVYGLVLEDIGVEKVLEKISAEPSSDAFNSISLESGTGRPLNPMINAGAIASTSLIAGKDTKEKFSRLLNMLQDYAGRELSVDWNVYRSEKKTGHRNKAIAHLLKNFDIIEGNLNTALQLYFQQCSVLTTCTDLAIMASTLANDGINPVTGKRVIRSEFVPLILSVMSLCGMYDYSGRWIYEVGLPAKSGIGGGVIAVLPGQFGFSVFSPKLDSRGNSVRGVQVCKQFSHDYGLHLLRAPKMGISVVRACYTLTKVRSKKIRNKSENLLLDKQAKEVVIFELQGEMRFASAEVAVRKIFEKALCSQWIIIDVKRVPLIDEGAYKLFEILFHQNEASTSCNFLLAHASLPIASALRKIYPSLRDFIDKDHAIEWCENQIIARIAPNYIHRVAFAENELCTGLSEKQLTLLNSHAEVKAFQAQEHILQSNGPLDTVYFILQGEVSCYMKKNSGKNP